MQNIANKVRKNFQDLEKYLKLKFTKKRSVPQHILFQDFLRCEITARNLGFKFSNDRDSSANKWTRLNNLAYQSALTLVVIAELFSLVVAAHSNLFYIMIENFLFCGCAAIVGVKIYIIFYQKRAKIDEIVDNLDHHFPHYGVDQLTFKVQKYLGILKLFEAFYYVIFVTTCLQFCLMPFLHQIYGAIGSTTVKWENLLTLVLPFDQLQPVVYALMWFLVSWNYAFSAHYIVCTYLLFSSLMQILAMEFDILSQIISEIDMTEGEDEAIKELKKLVDIHQELIDVSKKVNEIFSPLMLINTFGAIFSLCAACFLLVVIIKLTAFIGIL